MVTLCNPFSHNRSTLQCEDIRLGSVTPVYIKSHKLDWYLMYTLEARIWESYSTMFSYQREFQVRYTATRLQWL